MHEDVSKYSRTPKTGNVNHDGHMAALVWSDGTHRLSCSQDIGGRLHAVDDVESFMAGGV